MRIATRLSCLLIGLALPGLAVAPTIARAESYAALGDSYSSGVGTGSYYADSGGCRRSPNAYPVLLASRLGASLGFAACSGAETGDVLRGQLWPLDRSTDYVTVSIGGNDAGFSSVLGACAAPWPVRCEPRVAAAESYIRDALPARLARVYAAIRGRAPAARIAVVGYPRLFDGRDCSALTFFSAIEEAQLNRAADLLAAVEGELAASFGFRFVDPRAAFSGHEICDPDEWLNGLSSPLTESFHPTASGHASGYLPLVYASLRRGGG